MHILLSGGCVNSNHYKASAKVMNYAVKHKIGVNTSSNERTSSSDGAKSLPANILFFGPLSKAMKYVFKV